MLEVYSTTYIYTGIWDINIGHHLGPYSRAFPANPGAMLLAFDNTAPWKRHRTPEPDRNVGCHTGRGLGNGREAIQEGDHLCLCNIPCICTYIYIHMYVSFIRILSISDRTSAGL